MTDILFQSFFRRSPSSVSYLCNSAAILILTASLTGCGSQEAPADSQGDASPPSPATEPKTVYVESGSIDIVVGGNTVERNSRGDPNSVQCQLSFTVTNRGASEIKTLLVDYHLLNKTTAEVIKEGRQMVIATKIGVGESASPWGGETVDDFRCIDLALSFPPQPSYQCRTTTSAKCAAFTYEGGDGVTVANPAPTP